ncbi:MAG TPA: RbsD/FucU domain-containing protein [Terriglobia bacterium]|nr:RbsD/FucU domain-containing protein [Terriglobia bacterium]
MLKGLDPLLSPDLLFVLAAMGHGDELAIVDANFPALSNARRLIRLDGASAPRALQAVLSLMPLDDFVDAPMAVMEVVGDPTAIPGPVKEFQVVADNAEGRAVARKAIDRFAFYDRAKTAFAIVATGETRLYGCVLIKKGVIGPQE